MKHQLLLAEDLSCAGQVSLSVGLSILGASGCEPTCLPTTLLSTHTGGFGTPARFDLSSMMTAIISHWQHIPLEFDQIYLGYLGQEAIDVVIKELPRVFSKKHQLLLDPAMADNGRFYRGFDLRYAIKMRELVTQADLVTPNVTEACLLLDRPLVAKLDLPAAKRLISDLQEKFPSVSWLLTGVSEGEDIVVLGLFSDQTSPKVWHASRVPGNFMGTGDVFASLIMAGRYYEVPLPVLIPEAMSAITQMLQETSQASSRDSRLGPIYNEALLTFCQKLATWRNNECD